MMAEPTEKYGRPLLSTSALVPQLDLVTHIIINDVLPRVQRTLDYVQNVTVRRVAPAKALGDWRVDFGVNWLDMGCLR